MIRRNIKEREHILLIIFIHHFLHYLSLSLGWGYHDTDFSVYHKYFGEVWILKSIPAATPSFYLISKGWWYKNNIIKNTFIVLFLEIIICFSLSFENVDLVISLFLGNNSVVKRLNWKQMFKLTLINNDVYNLCILISRHLNLTRNIQMTHLLIKIFKRGKKQTFT